MQQKGTFETGQEDSTEIPEELKLRLAYRESAVAVLACYFPDPYRPFTEVQAAASLFGVISVSRNFLISIPPYLFADRYQFHSQSTKHALYRNSGQDLL